MSDTAERLPLKALNIQGARVVSYEDRQAARAWVRDLVENQGSQYTTIAEQIGYSRSSVMRFVAEDHGGVEMVRKILDLKDLWQTAATPLAAPIELSIPFINTEDTERVLGVCRFCANEPAIGVIVGHAGAGKTTTLRQWCQNNPLAIYISADVTMNTRGVLEEIANPLMVSTRGTLRDIMRRLIEHLKRDRRVIVIDEADVLVSYSDDSVRKLEVLRPLHDRAGASIILAGLPRLKVFLTRGPSLKQDFEQIYSRVRIMAELKGLTREEATEILAGYPMTEGAREMLVTAAVSRGQGGMRRLTTLLQKCIEMANTQNTHITREIVQAADRLALL
jgi:DNA transposition AAA+ family ATPase